MDEMIKVENLIYKIRDKEVMLDSDLAKLYKCTNGTKDINKAVNRNIQKFPQDFYFQLTKEEQGSLWFQHGTSRFQIGTLNKRGSNIKYLSHAFTEEGVAMLASVLKTSIAAEVSVNIMRAFVSMRKYISNDLLVQKDINNMVIKHDNEIKKLQETFSKFKEKTNEVFFEGQIYDAYSKIIDIISKSEKELIIIDSYADKSVLDIISKIKANTLLITSNKNRLKEIDIEKYNKQYSNLKIIYNDSYHDRYLIIDNKEVYHLGTSLNNAGTKTFSINKLEDKMVMNLLVKNTKKKIESSIKIC